MQYESVYIEHAGDLETVAAACRGSRTIGLDFEVARVDTENPPCSLSGLTAKQIRRTALDPHLGRPRLLSLNPDGCKEVFVVDLFKTGGPGPIRDALHNPEAEVGKGRPIIIGHNLQFDQKMALHHYDMAWWPVFDTYRASCLVHNGRGDSRKGHKLEKLYERDLGFETRVEAMGKSDWSQNELSEKQLDYATEDVTHLPDLRETLREQLREQKLNKVALIEFQAVLPEAVIERNGFWVDWDEWNRVARGYRDKRDRFRGELMRELPHPGGQLGLFADIGAPWNLNSAQQMQSALARYGIRVPDTNAITLKQQSLKYPIIEKIVDFREAKQRWSSFGPKYQRFQHPLTGRVHSSFFPFTGAGRYSNSDPNLQQIPRTADYRNCFRARPGFVLVGADYSQIELRIMAQLSQDPVLLQLFREGHDPHKMTASIVMGVPLLGVTGEQRQMAKPINFGLIYGLMPKRLVSYAWANYGVRMTEKEAVQFHRRYFDGYEGVRDWQQFVMRVHRPRGFSRTLSGRKRYLESHTDYNNYYNCVDAETEALTRRGWVKGPDLRRDDTLLTKNADTGELEWQDMDDLKTFSDYKGRIVSFRSRSFNAVTTPQHRWLVKDKHSGQDVCRMSDQLSQWGDYRIHRTGTYSVSESCVSDTSVELVGWLLTDGTLCEQRGRKIARIYQSARANAGNVERIDALFERIDVECLTGRYHYPQHSDRVTWELKRDLAERLHRLFPGRLLSAEFLGYLNRDQAVLLMETMLRGDGWTEKGGRQRFCCRSKEAADAFQALCVLAGVATTCAERDMSKYTPKSEKLQNVPKGGTYYVVNLLKRTHAQVLQGHREDREVEDFFVWCPIVKNTYFVARREGQVYITGNTPVQGTGADGLKNALWYVWHRLKRFGSRVQMVHMVHDEIITEVEDDPDLVAEVKHELQEGMIEGIVPFLPDVPVEVDAKAGPTWASIH